MFLAGLRTAKDLSLAWVLSTSVKTVFTHFLAFLAIAAGGALRSL